MVKRLVIEEYVPSEDASEKKLYFSSKTVILVNNVVSFRYNKYYPDEPSPWVDFEIVAPNFSTHFTIHYRHAEMLLDKIFSKDEEELVIKVLQGRFVADEKSVRPYWDEDRDSRYEFVKEWGSE